MRNIPGFNLWIGHVGDARDIGALMASGIEAVVGLAHEELPNAYPRNLIFCRFPLIDGRGNPRWLLAMAIETVATLLRSGTPTLVYCGASMSRSPCIAAAAIALTQGCDSAEALDLVTQAGPADLAAGFWNDVLVELAEVDRRPRRLRPPETCDEGAIDMTLPGLVKPIPEGYNTVTPYLIVADATDAIDFYKKAFGATELFRIAGPDGKVDHAEIRIGDSPVMLADEHPEMGAKGPKALGGSPVSMVLYVENVDAFVEKAVAAGATLTRPVEDKFYGDRGGSVDDPYGHSWHVMTHIEDVSPEEMKRRAAEFKG